MNLAEALFLIESNFYHESATRRQVRERAVEIAGLNGRRSPETSKADWEQAKRELIGPSTTECPQPHILLSPNESDSPKNTSPKTTPSSPSTLPLRPSRRP